MEQELLQKIYDELKAISFQSKRLYTTEEVAEIFSTYGNKVNVWRKAGLITGIKKGREWIYPAEEIDRFIKANLGKDLTMYK